MSAALSAPRRFTLAALRRPASAGAAALAAAALSACAPLPEGPTTCTDQGMTSGSWPYCAPAEPAGYDPSDDPIDPTGRRY